MAGGGKTTQTNEVKLPEWLNQGVQSTFQQAQATAAANPVTAYKGPTSAGTNTQLETAATGALATGTGAADLDAARRMTTYAGTAPTSRVGTSEFDNAAAAKYMDPYKQQVQANTVEEMRRVNAMEMDALGDSAAGSKAYGGSRHAVLEAETGKNQNRNIMDYLAQSNSAAFNDAYGKFSGDRSASMDAQKTNLGAEQSDLMRMMQGGGQRAGIGAQAQGMQTQDIDNLVKTGMVQQGTEAGQVEGDYNEFLRMQDAPMQRYAQLMGLLTGAPTNRTETGTTKQKQSLLPQILGAGASVASLFSDRRLKCDIERVGQFGELGIYEYRYLWSRARHVGFMADEVARAFPAAVRRVFGFDAVDYSAILAGA